MKQKDIFITIAGLTFLLISNISSNWLMKTLTQMQYKYYQVSKVLFLFIFVLIFLKYIKNKENEMRFYKWGFYLMLFSLLFYIVSELIFKF